MTRSWLPVFLSDGLLTEFAVRHLNVRVHKFYSMASAQQPAANLTDRCAIVGSNWLEFRSMSEANCFIVLEHDRGSISEGDLVNVQLMEGNLLCRILETT